MTEVARPLHQKVYRAFLLTAFAAAALTVGCHHTPVVSKTEPTPPPPAARPTVTVTADPTSIKKGDSATLDWSSTNATSLRISPEAGAVAPEASSNTSARAH